MVRQIRLQQEQKKEERSTAEKNINVAVADYAGLQIGPDNTYAQQQQSIAEIVKKKGHYEKL